MITNKELTEVSLSPTKKDYYQIWNELIDLATKISSRWSPDSTNESDPGIVLLKSLVAIADKLNYNIDKNTLEAFMPSATQQESMRKLTEMMGYTMKYYQAATCKVSISYKDSNELSLDRIGSIYFPKFINLKNEEEDVNYVTLEEFTLQPSEPSRQIMAIEGELVECESSTDNIISLIHLDDNNRYILPESNVAENALFICNIIDSNGVSRESDPWKQVGNLNTQLPGTCVYKFGFDSIQNLPYIQFPDDISQLIKDGLRIKYIRTNGVAGNISARILNKLEIPALWSTAEEGSPIRELTADDFSITNISAASNGADPESITAAYNNFKKTVGTFDTLVTCRDYMNKIYQLTKSENDTTPLVSNIIVSDIRDDINRAVTLCSFDDYGICYSDVSLKTTGSNPKDKIEHFDLVLYPFKTIYGLNTTDEYINSFRLNYENLNQIKYDLNDCKSISHSFITPDAQADIGCIKNYLRLKASVMTNKKVTAAEEREILNNIYTAIYKNFNCHQLDFGEEIPYDTLVDVIKNADTRIKDINLDEPALYTYICGANGVYESEYPLEASISGGTDLGADQGSRWFNQLVLRNVLAGKIAAFSYDNDFMPSYADMPYDDGQIPGKPGTEHFEPKYPEDNNKKIIKMESKFFVNATEINEQQNKELELNENEVIQFRMPNLKTTVTYPSYVNYYIKLDLKNKTKKDAIAATFISLSEYLNKLEDPTRLDGPRKWKTVAQSLLAKGELVSVTLSDVDAYNSKLRDYGAVFIKPKNSTTGDVVYADRYYETLEDTQEYCVVDTSRDITFSVVNDYISRQTYNETEHEEPPKLSGIYRTLGADTSRSIGKYVDEDHIKYMLAYKASLIKNLFVQGTHPLRIPNPDPEHSSEEPTIKNPDINVIYTEDGLGQDAEYPTIGKDAEYQLGDNDYLLINYTDSQTDSSGTEKKSIVNKYWGPGTIIKPNFPIIASELYHNNHTYSKKDGYYFEQVPDCPGMFTLATDEQICIREIVKVDLDDDIVYLYWERNDEDENAQTTYFEFDEYYYDESYKDDENYPDRGGILNPKWKPTSGDDVAKYIPNAYTLKDGEHLYYTNAKKTDLAYYGSGTLIVKSEKTPELRKNKTYGSVSEEDIMTYGIAAAIPWGSAYRLSKDITSGKKRKLTIIENQYISLTEGDILYSISNRTEDTRTFDLNLDNDWVKVGSASYKFAEDENGAIDYLPTVSINGVSWYAHSRLDFNMSPSTPQVLHKNDSITITMADTNGAQSKSYKTLQPLLHVIGTGSNTEVVLTPLAIYSNYQYNCAYSNVSVLVDNLKLKTAKVNTPVIGEDGDQSATINLNNYANSDATFTKFSFETVSEDLRPNPAEKPVFSLNTNILSGDLFGLVMFYYIDEIADPEHPGYSTHHNARIEVETDGTEGAGIRVFNKVDSGDSRAAMAFTTYYTFKPGIQMIELSKGVTKIKVYADYHTEDFDEDTTNDTDGWSYQSILVFDDIKLVTGANTKLNYRFTDKASAGELRSALEQLLYDIRHTGVADDFYYSNPINRSNDIELNNNIDTDTLASPAAWYDPNNVNNKFVISEIDAEYLPIGITLTRASRL